MASLLERFYEPTSGEIHLDGHVLSELDVSWLREHIIGYINQEPVLFATSVMENIRYGCPSASDEEVHMSDDTTERRQAGNHSCKHNYH